MTAVKNMTPLGTILAGRIRAIGPMSVPDFHNACLYDPQHGYYKTQNALGRLGDFCTAPEVSPLFGDVVGAFLLNQWLKQGSPNVFYVIELGPGRGTLMNQILRVGALKPDFLKAVRVLLVETHPLLKEVQEATLKSYRAKGVSVRWCDCVPNVAAFLDDKKSPAFVVANEFFDVLPCQPFQKTEKGWCSRLIDFQEEKGFFWHLGAPDPRCVPPSADRYKVGDVFEDPAVAQGVLKDLLLMLQDRSLLFMCMDYGYEKPDVSAAGFKGDSWQAIYQKETASPLAHPGLSDLSFHVNFGAMMSEAKAAGLDVSFGTQADFLSTNGIMQRLQILTEKASAKERAALKAGVVRLTDPVQMGALFKVMVGIRRVEQGRACVAS